MGVEEAADNSIMSGIENTAVKQHNHKRKLRQRFDIIKKLGQGTFGKVQLGINKETGQEVAVKTIKKSKIESDADLVRIRREIQIMSSVQHPNIIHIYEVFENREKMVLVMEYAAGGELYDYLSERKVLTEDEARRIFRQIATACYYCHKHKICHRDLKLENILLDENHNAKIADFGLSNVFDDQRLLNTFCGSPLYASPEIVKGTPYHGPEVDCWSLGVLLYTLVYGAMPFDGSNFKRLVKQISQGDYYEPAKPSPASPLIRDMLTVNPRKRSDIEKICSHWWVNETYDIDCLEVSEELANQTPVRLDVLLTLAPPAPQLESEKLVVTSDVSEDATKGDVLVPTRSQSVGSLMELTVPERRIMDLINEGKFAPKRKLETTVSTDRANLHKRKDKIIKENTIADISVHGIIKETDSQEDISMSEALPLNKSLTQTISKPMDVDSTSIEGAACKELIEEAREKDALCDNKEAAIAKEMVPGQLANSSVLNNSNTPTTHEKSVSTNNVNKENKSQSTKEPSPVKKSEEKTGAKKKISNKKVLTDKNVNEKETKLIDNEKDKVLVSKDKKVVEEKVGKEKQTKANGVAPKDEKTSPTQEKTEEKPVERRKSRIFEAAEKFQNMITPSDTKPVAVEKPKKILIPDSMVTQPGVSVDGFKKEFERKASLTSIVPPKLKTSQAPKKTLIDKPKQEDEKGTKKSVNDNQEIRKPVESISKVNKSEVSESVKQTPEVSKQMKNEDDHKEKVKNAVSIISNALDKEGTRKSKSRPCIMRKPPVPFGFGGRSASGNIETLTSLNSPVRNMAPKPFVRPCYENKLSGNEAKQVKHEPSPPKVEEEKVSNAEITLKSATLPRRKTAKAQIQLNYPSAKPAQMGFRTEASHNVEAPQPIRSEVVVPVVGTPTPTVDFRASNDPQDPRSSKERIIPIAFERKENNKEAVQSPPPTKPPMPKSFQTQRSNISQKSNSLSRQSTQDSDSETTTSIGEPIKKSAREYIIPIAVEGGGYVTPRASSLEPTDSTSTTSTMTGRSKSRWGSRRLNSLLNDRDSEDESPFSTLHRHSSFGKDSDNEDSSRKDNFHHMHRLRSTRPKKATLEHADSLSSGEDDDEGFEILTAENLFSTLLSRVRDLTQRLNVEDGVRPGFPSSRLLSHFDHGTNFWNRMDHPLTRHSSLGRTFSRPSTLKSPTNNTTFGGVPWRRSVSRDLASDIESVFNDSNNASATTTSTARGVPRGDDDNRNSHTESLNLAELDLNKLNLSKEDQLALSHLTPGLSKRIQKQLLAQLTPAEVRRLHRTLSSKSSGEIADKQLSPDVYHRRSLDKMSSTLPRKIPVDKGYLLSENIKHASEGNTLKSFLPVKSTSNKDDCEFNVRSSSIGDEPTGAYRFSYARPKLSRSISTREPRISRPATTDLYSPDSSVSENLSKNDDTSISSLGSKYSILSRPYSKYSSDSSYSKYSPNISPNHSSISDTTEKKILQTPRKISRFLRPDFYETKEENVYVKEKKERERETQQVLKEIRDKRKNRLRSRSRGANESEEISNKVPPKLESVVINALDKEPEKLVTLTKKVDENKFCDKNKNIHDYVNVSGENNISSVEKEIDNEICSETDSNANNVKSIHDYVNVKVPDNVTPAIKKESKISRLVRPKSYPNETIERARKKSNNVEIKNEPICESNLPVVKTDRKESKIRKLKTGLTKKDKPSKEDKDATNKNINEEDKVQKNKLLQSIEKKLEKFRSNTISATKNHEEAKALLDKKSVVESAIKRLREQSLPRNLEPCTESGLIKRAVSVEDLAIGTKPLQASKKSVTKILGLFKKYEEQDKKKEKFVKKEKGKETISKVKAVNGSESNISKSSSEVTNKSDTKEKIEKKERPKSLLIGKMRHFQGMTSKSDSSNQTDNKKSKLPVNSFRRSLNLEDSVKLYKDNNKNVGVDSDKKPDRSNLKLDLGQKSINCQLLDSSLQDNRNSFLTATTDDSCSIILSPADECLSCDSWSACSDFHHLSDLHSPQSQINNNCHNLLCSGDEGESVSDRIRRKSFYTRFNEKKKPKKSTLVGMYKDLDTTYGRKEYGNSVDRYQSPSVSRRASFNSYIPETSKSISPTAPTSPREHYNSYGRNVPVFNDYVNVPGGQYNLLHSYQNIPGTHSNLIDSYQNLPSSYQTYSNNRTAKPKSLYSDSDSHLDDILKSAIPRRHSPYSHRSILDRGSISPVTEHYFTDKVSSSIQSPTTSEPF